MRWVSRLVTAGIFGSLVVLAVLFLRARIPDQKVGQAFTTYAKFRDGSHLAVGSPVVIAGVRVGDITRLSIEGRFARVDMRLVDEVMIPADSFVTRRADSLFGDSYIEIILGGGQEGATSAGLLRAGEPILHVVEGSSTDGVLRGIERAMPRIDNALGLVDEVVGDGRKRVTGDLADGITNADRWLASGRIEAPLEAARHAFERIDGLTTRGADALANTAPTVTQTLARIEQGVARARTGIHDARSQLVTALADTREGLDKIDPTVAQVAEVVTAIDQGSGADWKGTLGGLINKPDVADTLEDATAAGAEAVSSFNRFKSWLGMRLELNLFARTPRFYATAEIRARTDKFYLVEFERGSLGGVPTDQLSDVANTTSYGRVQEIHDTLRFTAQFGKQFGSFALRGGIKDSSFGFGIDVLLGSGRLQLSTDVFGSFSRTPRLKVAAAYAVFRSIYLIAGVDDALNTPGYLRIESGNQTVPNQLTEVRYGRDYFLGATLHFDDADLATLLRVYGALLAGALAF